jgi:uncharacterized protein YjbI with pentapeptide repeats
MYAVIRNIFYIIIISVLTGSCAQGGRMENEALRLLKSSEKKFNKEYAEAGKPIDLSNCYMGGMKIEGANLTGANLKGTNLTKAIFKNSILEKADLSGSILDQTAFKKCKMNGVKIIKTRCGKVFFEDCEITESDMHESEFKDIHCAHSTMGSSNLTGIRFDGGAFYKSEVQGCKLMNSKFNKILINDTNFIDSDLTDSIIHGEIIESSHFGACTLTRANFSETKFKGRLFSSPNFREANAKHANFSHCRMSGVSILGGADFEGADFSYSSLELLDFQEANLKKAKFFDTSLKSVNLGYSDLCDADFTKATFVDFVRLNDARLEGTKFNQVLLLRNPEIDLENTIYQGKSLPGTTKSN